MAKIYVIVTGLVALVDRGGNSPASILLRRTAGETVGGGVAVAAHTPRIRFRQAGFPRKTVPLAGSLVEFLPGGAGRPTIVNSVAFLKLGEFTGEDLRVRPGCLGPNPSSQCTVNGRPILAAKVELPGGEIYPLQIDETFTNRISKSIASHLFSGISFVSGRIFNISVRPVANGLIYEREIRTADRVFLKIDRDEIELDPEPVEELGELPMPPDRKAFVIWIFNIADVAGRFEPGTVIDPDFELLYDFAGSASDRPVPIMTPIRVYGSGDPPGKCMPALITG